MRLENIVWDARDPVRLGRFWAAALGAEVMTDEGGLEARLRFSPEVFLDLCFQHVAELSSSPQRLHLDLAGGAQQVEMVERLLGLGAAPIDVGQGDVPWVILADPEEQPFCVMPEREEYNDSVIGCLPLDCADPERDVALWAAITGWQRLEGTGTPCLRHPSGAGPALALCPEPEPKLGKNRIHLDVRPEPGDEDLLALAESLGAHRLDLEGAQGMPWTVFTDPSGNEFCILDPAKTDEGSRP